MSQSVYRNVDAQAIHDLELVNDDDKAMYNLFIESQSPIVHEQYIRHSQHGKVGIVVGFIDPKTGTPMVGWSIASKDDRDKLRKGNQAFSDEEYRNMPAAQKAGLRSVARAEYNMRFKTRAKYIAYKRALPAAEFIKPDRAALCKKCPAKAVPVVAKMVATIVGEWAHRLPSCHCPGRDPGPTGTEHPVGKLKRKKEAAIGQITRLLRKLAG